MPWFDRSVLGLFKGRASARIVSLNCEENDLVSFQMIFLKNLFVLRSVFIHSTREIFIDEGHPVFFAQPFFDGSSFLFRVFRER
ncbi:hypothetical protein [Prosthecochloris aestuarii]|uniref:hypothetical protein n=1 Tax=Prosthecochloris aestuarii TaxID=1102 RepID=UPI001427D99B|nr:hypothetical protein [Prosthecochloris aestuarii]